MRRRCTLGCAELELVVRRARRARWSEWIGQEAGTLVDLHAVHGAAGVVFAVGGDGTVLRRSADVRDAGVDAAGDAGDASDGGG